MTENCSFLKIIVFCFVAVIFSGQTAISQVGIGTTDPNANAALDIESANQGILIPRVALVNLSNNSPLTGAPVEGILVFNTATSGSGVNAVTPGFYYHNGNTSGVRWVRFMGSDTKTAWELSGNSGTTENDFLGTTDNRPLRIRANNTLRFEFTTGGHLRASYPGSATAPTYAWANKNGTGIFSPTNTEPNIGFSTGGLERFRIPNLHQVLGMNGGTAALPFYSWNGRTSTGMYSPANNQIGFSTNGTERFRIPNANQVHAMEDGTAGAPFYSWGADTNMGMYRAGTDILAFSTNGANRMQINNTGRVMINTTTPYTDTRLSVRETGANHAIKGVSISGIGASGESGTGYGVHGTSNDYIGTYGRGFAGIYGSANVSDGIGVGGTTTGTVNYPIDGTGVAGTGDYTGVYGNADDLFNGIGVMGVATWGSGEYPGMNMFATAGVYGVGDYGVVGHAHDDQFWGIGVFSMDDVGAAGAKSFIIDHPLDPLNKILKHASIESNEILNFYRGTAVFDGSGTAIVELPDYYEEININESYLLTPVGAAMPNLYIAEEIQNRHFTIAGGVPGKKVSWVVTAERNDAYMRTFPKTKEMEVDKGKSRGHYLTPKAYGQPAPIKKNIKKMTDKNAHH